MSNSIQNQLPFYEWKLAHNLDERQEDLVSTIIVAQSTLRYGDSKLHTSTIDMVRKEFPGVVLTTEIDFQKFDALMKSILPRIEFQSEELLYSFILQGLCVPLSTEILSSADTPLSRLYLAEIQKKV